MPKGNSTYNDAKITIKGWRTTLYTTFPRKTSNPVQTKMLFSKLLTGNIFRQHVKNSHIHIDECMENQDSLKQKKPGESGYI